MRTAQHHSTQSHLPQELPSDPLLRAVANTSPERFIFILILLGAFDILLWNTTSVPSHDSVYIVLLGLSVATLLRDSLLTRQALLLSSWRERASKNSPLTRLVFFIIFFVFLIFEVLSKVNFSVKFIPFALLLGIIGIIPAHKALVKFFERIRHDIEIQKSKIKNFSLFHVRLKTAYFAFLVPSRILILYASITNNIVGVIIGILIFFSLSFKEDDLYEKCPRCFEKRSKALSDQKSCGKCI